MPLSFRSAPRPVRGALALTVLAAVIGLPLSAGGAARADDGPAHVTGARGDLGARGCTDPIFDGLVRARLAAAEAPDAFAEAAAVNDTDPQALARAASDGALHLDVCGRALYVEPARPAAPTVTEVPARADATPAPSEAFALQSKPGSSRTLFLDFDGATTTGTDWNSITTGSSFTSPPFDLDGDRTTFSVAERTEIVRTWQAVAEDYAPFDVNVTTRDPGLAAINRTAISDTVYGGIIVITRSNRVYTADCLSGCGGIAYTDVFNDAERHMAYQPGFVFTAGVGTDGKTIADAVAHEAGHQFGLDHDGTQSSDYYDGARGWGPIMGAPYTEMLTQWSNGQYSGANRRENDTAIIATGAPTRPDDGVATLAGARTLAEGTPAAGLIERAADTDGFRFTAAGATTVTATGAPFGNLDIRLTILDGAGASVATVDPPFTRLSDTRVSGLDAQASFTAPSGGATYLAVVEGVGNSASTDDYGSLGAYTLTLDTGTASGGGGGSTPVATPDRTVSATVGRAVSVQLQASGGTGSYGWSAPDGLPGGLSLSTGGLLTGTPTAAGTSSHRVVVTSGDGSDSALLTVAVAAAPTTTYGFETATTLPAGDRGIRYRTVVRVVGGAPGYEWEFAAGRLHRGLQVVVREGAAKAVVQGTPQASGTLRFALRVTDAAGRTTRRTFSLTIRR
ncbi:putative Ig domain-containing protein [Nocardioides sp.]|uniref:putative Ig domain-containing protein n=1 Tax=Nocardioides sp. TaxID=35761 RepID=UPI003518F8A9